MTDPYVGVCGNSFFTAACTSSKTLLPWFQFCTDKIGDPFNDAAVGAWPGLPAGDPVVVYSGPDGPLDSIRWEVFAESLQDYAILQSVGVKPDEFGGTKLIYAGAAAQRRLTFKQIAGVTSPPAPGR